MIDQFKKKNQDLITTVIKKLERFFLITQYNDHTTFIETHEHLTKHKTFNNNKLTNLLR